MSFDIHEVAKHASTQLEQLGTKAKFWYRDVSGNSMLFKQGRPGTGENWAEKVSCEICNLLKLPHWLGQLEATQSANYIDIIRGIPDLLITEPAIDFALKMLEINRLRLLKVRESLK